MLQELINMLFLMLPRDEEGQALTEYGLILALVAIALIAGLTALAMALTGTFNRITSALGG